MNRISISSTLAAAAVAAALTGTILMPANAETPLATLTGTTDLSGGVAYLEVERATAFDSAGAPTQYTDTVVAQSPVNSFGQFTLTLPNTTPVTEAEANGWVNTLTVVKSGNRSTGNYQPVLLARTDPSVGSSTDRISPTTVSEGRLANAQTGVVDDTAGAVTPMDLTMCQWNRVSESEQPSRVGEIHVADTAGMSGTFTWHDQTDSDFSVGLSAAGSGWTTSGTFTLSESIGTNADFTDAAGDRDYANDTMYYGKFENNGAASCPGLQYKTHVIHSAGDIFRGTNTPGPLPYSSCHADPHGYSVIAYSGNWAKDQSTAVHYGTVASAFGYTFNGHTGYTSGIEIHLHDNGSSNTYACGTADMPNVPIVYSRSY
jgi:hypothetical protein